MIVVKAHEDEDDGLEAFSEINVFSFPKNGSFVGTRVEYWTRGRIIFVDSVC